MAGQEMLLGELKAEVRALRDELAGTKHELRETVSEAREAAVDARKQAQAAHEKLEMMKNRGYGFIAGVTLLAGAVGAKIQAIFHGG